MSTRANKSLAQYGCAIVFAALLLAFVIWPLVLMFAWNVFVGGVFHGPTINYPEAFALNLLFSVLRGVVNR